MSRVFVIGLDGATLHLVEPWAKAGKLPTLAKLMQTGSYGVLQSVMPVLSSAAWSTFMTGLNPGRHGIYDFARTNPQDFRVQLVNRTHNHGVSLWKQIEKQGLRSIVVNVPMTYPPEEINGVIVTGLGTPNNKTFTHPAELSKQLFQKGYEVNKMFSYRPGKEKEFLNDVYKMTGQLTELCLDLMKTEAWDFFMVVFRDTDELSHYFWKFMDAKHPLHVPGQTEYQDAILSYYQFVDSEMAKLLDRVGDDVTVVVLSDHGEGPLYRDVLLNEWLKQKGYLEVKLSGDTQKRGRQYLAKIGITRANISVALRKLKLSKVETWIKDKLGDRINILPKNSRAEFPEAIDWSKTQAFSFGYHGQIYINRNLLPKDENGEPLKSAYEALVKKIIQDLYQLRDPADGKPVVDHAFQKDEIYAGPYTNWAPDITVVMRNFSYITRLGYEFSSKSGEIFAPPSTFESGSHRQEGLLIISGPAATNHQGYFEEANLADVMPTILYILGCPVPQKLDGKALKNWVALDRPVIYSQEDGESPNTGENELFLDEEEEEEMVNRLKGLGYLD